MATVVTIQQPITRQEELGDLTEPVQALARFYRAFNNRDFAMREENWDNSAQPVIISPLGGITRGWRDIHSPYERIFSSPGRTQPELRLHASCLRKLPRSYRRLASEPLDGFSGAA
jgi:hypothetical protein